MLAGTFAAAAVAAPADIDSPATALRPGPPTGSHGRADDRRLPDLSGRQRVEHSGRRGTPASAERDDRRHDPRQRRRLPAPGLRGEPRLRDPVRRRAGDRDRGDRSRYDAYGDESDPGPFPIPQNAPIEGGASATGDRHVIAVQQGTCELFELFAARPSGGGLDRRVGSSLRSAVECAAPPRLDERRRRRASDLSRARPLRGGRHGTDPPRDPDHDEPDPGRVHPAGDAFRVESHRPRSPRDGPADAADGRTTTCRSSPGRHG